MKLLNSDRNDPIRNQLEKAQNNQKQEKMFDFGSKFR